METNNKDYERNYSHTHCWDNEQRNLGGVPPCGIRIEKHKQCCLCDTVYNKENWADIENDLFLKQWKAEKGANKELIDYIKYLLSSSKAKWKEELVGKIEEIKPSYITGDCTKEGVKQKNIYRQALQDCIEIIKEL